MHSIDRTTLVRRRLRVPLIDLLNEAVIVTDPTRKNDILRKYVVVRGSDCEYRAHRSAVGAEGLIAMRC